MFALQKEPEFRRTVQLWSVTAAADIVALHYLHRLVRRPLRRLPSHPTIIEIGRCFSFYFFPNCPRPATPPSFVPFPPALANRPLIRVPRLARLPPPFRPW